MYLGLDVGVCSVGEKDFDNLAIFVVAGKHERCRIVLHELDEE
jgi:hypothetical protein